MKLGKFILCAVCVMIISTAFSKSAGAASDSSILVDIIPQNPAPSQDVTITISSYANSLNTVSIQWSIGGKTSLSGIGKTSFSLKAPVAGSQTTVTVDIALPDGSIRKNIIIKPSVMVLLWQADDSYVPPFYKGKAMPSAESSIKVVALPEIRNGSTIVSVQNMTYSWQKDYNNDVNDSGYGKNVLIYMSDYLDSSNNISVTASTVDQKYSSQASLDIKTVNPKILFYKNNPVVGTAWESALLDPHAIKGNEIVEASPYFISPKELGNPRLTWNWSINDSSVNVVDQLRKNLLPLATETGATGTSKLKLEIKNQDKIFETASKEINITF